MADLALGGLERIIKACLAINKAVATAKHNKEDCKEIQTCVDRVTALLSWLQESTRGAVKHPSFSGALDDLADSMEVALELITDCQQRSAVRHLIRAGAMAKKLRRSHEDILHKLLTANFASNILQISVSVTHSLHYVGTHPPLQLPQPQVAGELNSYDSNFSAIEMRPGVNSNTAMVATGHAVPYASSSRLTEFNSLSESSLHLSSEENITTGGHAFVLKQKIVIRLSMASDKSRSKALELAAKADGISSMEISGEGKDLLVVVGQGVDTVCLTNALRRKIGHADVVMVAAAQESGHRRNGNLSAMQRFSHWSRAPRPASLRGKGNKTTLPATQAQHMAALPCPDPYVAQIETQDDSPSPRGMTAHLRDTAAHLREWLVEPIMPAHGLFFALAFLIFLGIELLSFN